MDMSADALQGAARAIDPRFRLAGLENLGGRAWALDLSTPEGGSQRLVLLTHSQGDRQRNANIARDEFRLLRTLTAAGLPVPRALHLCETHEPPFLLTAFVEGSVLTDAQSRKDPGALAKILSEIHALDPGALDLDFLPRADDLLLRQRSPPSMSQRRIQAVLQRHAERIPVNAPALLHGDFWLGNLLWTGDELAAIVDWEDAMIGDPLVDLGKSRLEMLWALGWDAMREYSASYLATNPQLDASALPFWDLWGAFRLAHFASFALDQKAIPRMAAQYQAFVDGATAGLDARQK